MIKRILWLVDFLLGCWFHITSITGDIVASILASYLLIVLLQMPILTVEALKRGVFFDIRILYFALYYPVGYWPASLIITLLLAGLIWRKRNLGKIES